MSTFTAAAIIPAYQVMAADLGKSVQGISYLTSLQIAILGGAPLFWRPLSNRYGRRPVFLLSLVCSLVCNIGCAKSPDYASMAACRALVAFFISPAAAIGSAVVAETFFRRERARYMGIWTVMVTLGVPFSPFIFGFVATRIGYRWIYWILAIVNTPPSLVGLNADANAVIRLMASSSCSMPSLDRRPAIYAVVLSIMDPTAGKSTSPLVASIRPHFASTTLFSLSHLRNTRLY